jgi:hypothetical protein
MDVSTKKDIIGDPISLSTEEERKVTSNEGKKAAAIGKE